ncbi:FecCD family ABC transporter permease [Dermabacteraceae bacterium P13103]
MTAPPHYDPRTRRLPLLWVGLTAALLLAVVISSGTGQFTITPGGVMEGLWRGVTGTDAPTAAARTADAALWSIRLPRVAMALLVGASLAVGGALMQGVFGNPLAEPGIVGVSAGAAACASVIIATGLSVLGDWTLVFGAFLGGLAATLVAYVTARQNGRTEVVTLVLTGIAVNAVAGSIIALMTFMASRAAREQIVFWQLGSLNGSRWSHVLTILPLAIICLVLSFLTARRLDLLSLGERGARHLGVNVERLRLRVILLVAVLTSAAVAFTGIIAFVGLVVPHVIRMLIGPGHRYLLPASMLAGAVLLLVADTLARTLVPYADLPIGLLTSLVGGPFFFYLIRRTRDRAGGWS